MGQYEPTIIAFVCNWCTYTAADLAGTSRLVQPSNMRMIRMMCTGMVDPKYVIKALLEGASALFQRGRNHAEPEVDAALLVEAFAAIVIQARFWIYGF